MAHRLVLVRTKDLPMDVIHGAHAHAHAHALPASTERHS